MSGISDKLADAGVRVEEMLWIPGATVAADRSNGGLDLLLRDFPKSPTAPLFADLPELAAFAGKDMSADDSPEQVAQALAGKPGFIFRVSAARWHHLRADRYAENWGNVSHAWRHAATEPEIATVALAWARDCHADDRRAGQRKYGWSDPVPEAGPAGTRAGG